MRTRSRAATAATSAQAELERHGVEVRCGVTVKPVARYADEITITDGGSAHGADLMLVAGGVKPSVELAIQAGVRFSTAGAIAADTRMRINLPDVFAARDFVHTHHALLPGPEAVADPEWRRVSRLVT